MGTGAHPRIICCNKHLVLDSGLLGWVKGKICTRARFYTVFSVCALCEMITAPKGLGSVALLRLEQEPAVLAPAAILARKEEGGVTDRPLRPLMQLVPYHCSTMCFGAFIDCGEEAAVL